jgi:hypothetical protein
MLAIAAEQGSAKTVLSKLLRALVDPSVAPVRALPRDERELFIAASHSHVLAFDNLSGLPPWLSDTLLPADERWCLLHTSAVHRSRLERCPRGRRRFRRLWPRVRSRPCAAIV